MSVEQVEANHSAQEEEVEEEIEEEEDEIEDEKAENTKRRKPGLVFLSTIPPRMNVLQLREYFARFGEIGRVYLQPEDRVQKKGRRKFTEGWIEFKSKRVAKDVVANLNNQKVGGKRRSPNYECLWTMKYLRGLKWVHLTERLAYEKAVHQNRMRTEIAQVKRETNFHIESMEKSKKFKRKAGGTTSGWRVEQKPTDEEILQKKMKLVKKDDQVSHIVNLFNPSNTD